jgi:3-phosphoshikimate 1-carboxyvinyltransferase
VAGTQQVGHLDLAPVRMARGTVRLPGSKSISNRVLLLAALARGTTSICDLLDSDDTQVMLAALRKLGVGMETVGPGELQVAGCGGRFPVEGAELFLGNAGTAFRPLAAVLAVLGGEYHLAGVPRMHERPIGDLVDALQAIGARIDYLGEPGFPPLAIHPGKILAGRPVTVRGDVSSQFLTALLLALPLAGMPTRIHVQGELISRPYVEITLNLMSRFGVDVGRDGWSRFSVPSAHYVTPDRIHVEGDASAASYFLAEGTISGLHGGGPVRVEGVGRTSIQGDVRFIEMLELMGAQVSTGDNWIEATAGPEARACGRLRAIDADLNHIPDAAMTLAILALFAEGTSMLRNIASWRVKETDRISAMATELRKLGAVTEEGADYLKITPPARLSAGAEIDTYDDHRMAMCFSLIALGGVPVRINDPGCVSKTFPEYFDAFRSIARG